MCAVVLAAGLGTRLRPLTQVRPKALCPVGNVPLLDRVLDLLAGIGLAGPERVAVNASWLADQVIAHVAGRATVSVEPDRPLGTTGGLVKLREWIDGRAVLVGNADAYLSGAGIDAILAGWDGATVRLLGTAAAGDVDGTFSGAAFAGFSLLPWSRVASLDPAAGELVRSVWRPAEASGALDVVPYPGLFLDTGTLASYLAANRHAASRAGGNLIAASATVTGSCRESVIGPEATVAGSLTGCVVWPGARVAAGEVLADAVRFRYARGSDSTVHAPQSRGP